MEIEQKLESATCESRDEVEGTTLFDDEGNDQQLLSATEATERQFEHQQQLGGSLAALQPGRFEFTLNPFLEKRSDKMGVRERHYTARVHQVGHFIPKQNLTKALCDSIHETFQRLIRQENVPTKDQVYLTLSSNRIGNTYGYQRLSAEEWLNGGERVDSLLVRLSNMLNSNEQFEMNDSFHLAYVHVRGGPQGTGRKRKLKPGHSNNETFKRVKKSVITIPKKGNLCCARAIVTGKAKVDDHPNWQGFQRGRQIQKEQALLLHYEVGVPFGPCGYKELMLFSNAPSLCDYQLLLVDAARNYNATSFSPAQDKKIVLLFDDGHYDVITTLPGFFGTSYFCDRCLKPYNDEGKHACSNNPDRCPGCQQQGCPDYTEAKHRGHRASMLCNSCRRSFYGRDCLDNHSTKSYQGKRADAHNLSVCTQRRKCEDCGKLMVGFKEQEKHRCGFVDCPSCEEYVEAATHQCYIQVPKSPKQEKGKTIQKRGQKKAISGAAAGLATLTANGAGMREEEEDKPPLHVFFDIEAMQNTNRHVPNLIIAETEHEGSQVRYKGDHCVRDFLEWLDTLTENDTRPITVIAHNFQGYDGYFIVDEYHKQHRIVQQIRNGAKLLQVTFDRIRFIDSLSFFQMPLSDFPKTFGLTELKKGYFPHLFNVSKNKEYVGPIPDKNFYMPESMSVKGREEFEQWHAQQVEKKVIFDFAKELVEYCESDVKLLKEGCLTFKRLFEGQSNFNPFSCITIASACNRDLRQNRMAPKTIASEPLHGWRMKTGRSKASLEWLLWEEHRLIESQDSQHLESVKSRIRHAGNQDEYRISQSRYTVDGYDAVTNTVYEFQGCFYHGCLNCYPNRQESHKRLLNRSPDDVYQCTQRKLKFLKDRGYNVVEMWECEWRKMKQDGKDVRAFVDTLKLVELLEPRDAFFGGRTNAIKLIHSTDETVGEQLKYYDFTSLYPYVNKNGKYPIGHPEIIFQPGNTDISKYFGLAKCTVLPPEKLFHPVLPFKQNGKLTFPLCEACISDETSKPMMERMRSCYHTDKQRQFTGTWCTPELMKAVEKGYRIVHIHEVWHFSQTKQSLFRDYVNTWLKIKEEASGWPSYVGDDPVKQRQHLSNYEAREGIRLNPQKVEKNPGLRTLAKMMLNSMWGKFGQRPNKTQVLEFNDPIKFATFHESDKYDIQYVSVLTEERVEIHFKYEVEDSPVSPNLNIFVACFTTCWARLRLYDVLDLLQERVLYFDTDSVVFRSLPGHTDPPLGIYLGDFKDELPEGDFIVEFASAGPKNYGYKTKKGKQECKVRGISLNSEASKQLNYDVLKQNVLNDIQQPLECGARQTNVVKPYHIVRDAKQYTLQTVQQTKKYRLVYDKRVIDASSFQTYPYGYERLNQK